MMTIKTKIKFAGVNSNSNLCYVTEKGTYLALIGDNLRVLNQAPDYGFCGIEGEPSYAVNKDNFEVVESFNNENNESN